MGINKIVIGTTVGLLLLVALIYFVAEKEVDEQVTATTLSNVTIVDTWDLPKILKEISGIAFLKDDRIMGVQDELGKLFIYDLDSRKIVKEIPFGDTGDYEGVAVHESTAFVLRSNGNVIKIENYATSPQVSEISTFLTEAADTEGLCLDLENNRLLVATKEEDPHSGEAKGIYAIGIDSWEMEETPAFTIDLKHSVFEGIDESDLRKVFRTSEININPETGQIYAVDGVESRLLVMDSKGKPQKLYDLGSKDFPQPEGISFDSSGNLYISNEGDPATIHRVTLN